MCLFYQNYFFFFTLTKLFVFAYKTTPLYFACIKGSEKIAKYLIEKGADVNLMSAVPFKSIFIKYFLIFLSLSIIILIFFSYKKVAPIHIATDKDMYDTVKALVEHGCNVNVKDKDGLTPLEISIENDDQDIFRLLMEHNAKIPEKYKKHLLKQNQTIGQKILSK